MVNSGGSPLYLPPEQSQHPPNQNSLLASVAAGRQNLLYTELYKNLFKSVGKNFEGANEDFRIHGVNREHKSSKVSLPEFRNTPDTGSEILQKSRKYPKYDISSGSLVGHSPLRSFYEGIYNRITPNDYLLRLRAEQQFATKARDLSKKASESSFTYPPQYPNYTSHRFGGSESERGSAFRRTDATPPAFSPQQLHPTLGVHSPTVTQHKSTPDSGTKISPSGRTLSPRLESTVAPIDFSLNPGFEASSRNSVQPGSQFLDHKPNKFQFKSASVSAQEYFFNFKSVNLSSEGGERDAIKPMPRKSDSSPLVSPPASEKSNVPCDNITTSMVQKDSSDFDSTPDRTCATDQTKTDPTGRESPGMPELRLKRKRRLTSSAETCPVCGVTARASEMQQHFLQEVARLERIAQEVYRSSRKVYHDKRSTSSTGSNISNQPGTSVTPTTNKKQTDHDGQQSQNKENRFKTFQKVCANRIDRFNSRVGQCQTSMWRNGITTGMGFLPNKNSGAAWLDYNRNVMMSNHKQHHNVGGRFEGVRCPVCDTSLGHLTNHDQISDHVIQCAGSRQNGDVTKIDASENIDVDVTGDDDNRGFGEEYEWCGETRVRATALVHRDTLASNPGFQVIRRTDNEDSDQDLNVETDETCEFGAVQFTDTDLVPPYPSDEEGTSTRIISPTASLSPSRTTSQTLSMPMTSTRLSSICVGSNSPSVVVQALRLKIQELENENHCNRCLICMEAYNKPLVSIQCWHVHCEKCWMRALGVKKLCPQCNMITPASQLRRIYL